MDIGLPQERKQSVALWEMIEYPFVFDHDGQRYIFYNGNSCGKTGIGLAALEK
jgi:hypothetical protein